MRVKSKTRGRRGALLGAGVVLLLTAGCGGDDFEDKPRPALPIDLTAVIQDTRVSISPNRVGAGAVRITISNQTEKSHTLTLQGETVEERVGPINPEDAGTIQKTLGEGTYELTAGSGLADDIAPGKLVIGPERDPSNEQLLQP